MTPNAVKLQIKWVELLMIWTLFIVIVGGITRLTDSGLSITEWKPITGIIPPLSEKDWLNEFELYKKIPEFSIVNPNMDLNGFKWIYFWEFLHRFLARFLGFLFFFPFLFFSFQKKILFQKHFLFVFFLGGLQGLMGWYMVKSGLTHRVDVSHFRLAAHFSLALLIFLNLFVLRQKFHGKKLKFFPIGFYHILFFLFFIQWIYGAFMAGTDAGLIAFDFPKMQHQWIPTLSKDIFNHPNTIHFIHRWLGIFVFILVLMSKNKALIFFTFVQVCLGIATILFHVPWQLAILHQLNAFFIFAVLIQTMLKKENK